MLADRPSLADRGRTAVEQFSLRNFVLALCAASLVAAVSAGLVLRGSVVYEARTVLLIDSPLSLATAGDDGTIVKLERLRSKYATLAGTEEMADPVAAKVGLRPGQVITSTDVVPPPATLTLVVVARADKRTAAVDLSTAMSEQIIDYVAAEHVANNVPPQDRFLFRSVQPARFAAKITPTVADARTSALLGFGAALAVGYLILQLLQVPAPAEGDERRRRSAAPRSD